MKPNKHFQPRRLLAGLAVGLALGGMALGTTAHADVVYLGPTPDPVYLAGGLNPGGIPAAPTITSFLFTPPVNPTNGTFNWYGMRGWYNIEAHTNASFIPATNTITVAHVEATDYAWGATGSSPDANNQYYFRLNQSNNFYAGSGACGGCHGDKYSTYAGTLHSAAYNLFGGNTNYPVTSLTVGAGQPTGFTNTTNTPALANVGCENCHGPAGWHKNSDHVALHPAVSVDPQICGGCHTGPLMPTYDEWAASKHAVALADVVGVPTTNVSLLNVTYDITPTNAPEFITNSVTVLKYYLTNSAVVITNIAGTNTVVAVSSGIISFSNSTIVSNGVTTIINTTNDVGGYDRQMSCGPCHSGATRAAMLADYEARQAGVTNYLALPDSHTSAAWGALCANCHDPHSIQKFPTDVLSWSQVVTNGVIKTTNLITFTNIETTQLRNPTRSTKYFSFFTGSDKRTSTTTNGLVVTTNVLGYYNTVFASQYDPTINVCGQCHNSRGARWDGLSKVLTLTTNVTTNTATIAVDILTNVITTNVYGGVTYYTTNSRVIGRTNTTIQIAATNIATSFALGNTPSYSRAPHPTDQYNMLIGIVQDDYLNTNALGVATNYIARHGVGISSRSGIYNTNQCAMCHVVSYAVNATTNVTGHTFDLATNNCIICHSSGAPDITVQQTTITNALSSVVVMLNSWATNKGPALFTTNYSKYKQNGWEFTSPGSLAGVTNAGPSASEQTNKIPVAIRQARFNLYMVYGDGSWGVHNPKYTAYLITDASNKVWQASQ
jgi:Cytochrome c554 and c-prime